MLLIAPILLDLHKQFEVTTMAKYSFDFPARRHTNSFQSLRPAADDDLLLRLAFDKDGTVDTREVITHLFPAFGYDGGHVGNFFSGRLENLFADNFSNQHAQRLIGEFLG